MLTTTTSQNIKHSPGEYLLSSDGDQTLGSIGLLANPLTSRLQARHE